ncbi:hypothetical protein F2Q69_00010061 [Brassica cretica]|uniref:Uncharacterized protein n=1 Tax=Brassica cretica TaxID=69181 RepID=A0A8S9NZ46_BRACR|nr:hypothetical protein F2Q69_00010061 [Brassica cretica]
MRCGQKSCKVVERCKEGSKMGIKNGSMPFRVMSGWEVCGHSMYGRVLCGQTMRCGQTSCEVGAIDVGGETPVKTQFAEVTTAGLGWQICIDERECVSLGGLQIFINNKAVRL